MGGLWDLKVVNGWKKSVETTLKQLLVWLSLWHGEVQMRKVWVLVDHSIALLFEVVPSGFMDSECVYLQFEKLCKLTSFEAISRWSTFAALFNMFRRLFEWNLIGILQRNIFVQKVRSNILLGLPDIQRSTPVTKRFLTVYTDSFSWFRK